MRRLQAVTVLSTQKDRPKAARNPKNLIPA
nr:MAG TPA: hypothetical protein [Caudoviricetes sp.]